VVITENKKAIMKKKEIVIGLFLKGDMTMQEIAAASKTQVSVVVDIMIAAHKENRIDLIPWIECNINSKALYRGCEYFKKIPGATIEEACALLDHDVVTLKLCKLYVGDHMSRS